jgi:hypothetical protein
MDRLLSRRQARMLAIAVAGGRAALGVTAIVAPDAVARPWIGDDGGGPGRRVLARALGGRDLALGLGALAAARPEGQLRGWVEAGGLADAGDVAATVLAFRHLPARGRWLVLAAAGGAVAAAALAAPSL